MKRLILGVAAALLLSAGPAAADGLPSKGSVMAVEPAGPNWNGFYLGVGIGGGAAVTDLNVDASVHDYPFGAALDGFGGQGFFGVVTAGIDRVIRPGWVAGVFADYDFGSNISTDFSFYAGHNGGSIGLIDHNSSWAVGGRLGYLFTPSTLVYGTAGYTQADFDFVGGHLSKTFDGYFVGGGIETFLRPNWTLKLEYRYASYNDETIFGIDGRSFDLAVNVEPTIQSARLVLSYKFGAHD